MASAFEAARHARRLATALDDFAVVPLLRAGLRLGLCEALRTPQHPAALAERLGLAPDLVAAWARMLHAQGWLARKGEAYRLAPPLAWLLDAPEADALLALLDTAADMIGPRLAALPALLKGAERPLFGERDDGLRLSAITRVVEPRALRALERIPGARRPRRVLDIGCGHGHYLADLLRRFRDALGLGIELDPRVAEEARRRLVEADVARRAEIRVGDFLTMEPPAGRFDLVLLNHNLHHFSPAQRVTLLRRARACLDDDGVVAVQTLVLTEGLLPSLLGLQAGAALFDLVLRTHRNLHGLPAVDDVHRALREAGLAVTGEVPVVPGGAVRFIWGAARAAPAAVR
jgi:SAM-dependent methyltransferase